MRIAVVFPPQWDPRQPPRAPLVLEAAAVRGGAEARVFDLNLALFRSLLGGEPMAGTIAPALDAFFHGSIFDDPKKFGRISGVLERALNEGFSDSLDHQLAWDALRMRLSADATRDWKRVIERPTLLPAIRHLEREIAGLVAWAPDIVAISVISDTQLLNALGMASVLRRRRPSTRLVLGGDAFAYRQGLLPDFTWLFDLVDGIGIADGEPVLEALARGTPIADLPGVFTRTLSPPPSPLASAHQPSCAGFFDRFVPTPAQAEAVKWSLSPRIVVPIETARGCPWGRCAFCIHPAGTREAPAGQPPRDEGGHARYHARPLEAVAEELQAWFRHGFNRFFFIDEALPPQRLAEIARLTAKLPGPISWIGYARLDRDHTRETFTYARATGLRKLFFGLETGSPRLLEKYKKGIVPQTASRILREAGAAGIAVHLFLMTGFPGETEADRLATLALLDEVLPALDPFGFTYDLFGLKVERETPLFEDPAAFGACLPGRDASNDAAYQLSPMLTAEERASATAFSHRLEGLISKHHGDGPNLRRLWLSQDSLHLLLLEEQGDGRRPIGGS